MGHPPRIPVWLRWDQSVIYFVTLCVANRKPVLANKIAFIAFQHAAAKLRGWTVLAAILMPDHLHVIVAPMEDREAKVGNCVAAIKRWMRQEWAPHGNGSLVLSIVSFAPMNRCTTSGSISKKTPSAPVW